MFRKNLLDQQADCFSFIEHALDSARAEDRQLSSQSYEECKGKLDRARTLEGMISGLSWDIYYHRMDDYTDRLVIEVEDLRPAR